MSSGFAFCLSNYARMGGTRERRACYDFPLVVTREWTAIRPARLWRALSIVALERVFGPFGGLGAGGRERTTAATIPKRPYSGTPPPLLPAPSALSAGLPSGLQFSSGLPSGLPSGFSSVAAAQQLALLAQQQAMLLSSSNGLLSPSNAGLANAAPFPQMGFQQPQGLMSPQHAALLAAANPLLFHPQPPPTASYEGVPIFLLPTGASPALTLPMLHKAQEMKVNWATQPGQNTAKVDTSKHFHVFVGDLSPEVDNKALRDAFQPYGEMSDCKVIRDAQTLKSKGYGFVSYISKDDAEKAIEAMNGQWLGRRTIRTNWATRKPGGAGAKPQSYDEVYNSTTPTNTTVYVGGTPANATEEDLRAAFGAHGPITEVRLFKAQGYAFVRFEAKDAAANSIVALNGSEVAGATVRCSWGRQQDPSATGSAGAYGYAYGYGGGAGPGAAAAQMPASYAGVGGGGAAANQAAWNQYWQQYYSNPAMMQQWQSYYQQQGGQ